MRLENWTPHEIRLVDSMGAEMVLPPMGPAPRLETQRTSLGIICNLRVVKATLGEPKGLPSPRDGVVLVVSALVAEHPSLANREDLAYPGEAIRDSNGKIVGASGLCAGPGMARRMSASTFCPDCGADQQGSIVCCPQCGSYSSPV